MLPTAVEVIIIKRGLRGEIIIHMNVYTYIILLQLLCFLTISCSTTDTLSLHPFIPLATNTKKFRERDKKNNTFLKFCMEHEVIMFFMTMQGRLLRVYACAVKYNKRENKKVCRRSSTKKRKRRGKLLLIRINF